LEEWDQAAGRNVKGRQHPFQDDWGKIQQDPKKAKLLAINRPDLGPMGLDEETLDLSPFHCRHMSGNGREWTDTLGFNRGQLSAVFPNFRDDDVVVLRGKRYVDVEPFQFIGPDVERPPMLYPFKTNEHIGFRVVIR